MSSATPAAAGTPAAAPLRLRLGQASNGVVELFVGLADRAPANAEARGFLDVQRQRAEAARAEARQGEPCRRSARLAARLAEARQRLAGAEAEHQRAGRAAREALAGEADPAPARKAAAKAQVALEGAREEVGVLTPLAAEAQAQAQRAEAAACRAAWEEALKAARDWGGQAEARLSAAIGAPLLLSLLAAQGALKTLLNPHTGGPPGWWPGPEETT
jgi:hypothetical protein